MAIEDPAVITPDGKYIPCYFDGGGIDLANSVFVESTADLPAASGGVITLEANHAYFISGTVDLNGARLACAGPVTIYGASSETSFLKSTGLAAGTALITSTYTLPLINLTIDHAKGVALAAGAAGYALDWRGVNFTGTVGTASGYNNVICVQCAFFAGGFTYDLAVNTIGFDNCIFIVPAGGVGINIPATGIINRRLRVNNSSFLVAATGTGIYVDSAAYNLLEALIAENVNFSGAGTPIDGKTPYWNNWYLKGIRGAGLIDTFVNGQVYMQGNATATTIAATNTFYKAAGTTSASSENSRTYMDGNNKIVYDALLSRKVFMVATGTVTVSAGSNQEVEVGFYDSTLGAVRTPSRQVIQVENGTTERPFAIHCFTTWNNTGQFIEFHVANKSATNNVVVKNLNLTVSEV
jgi:hypothetical protein